MSIMRNFETIDDVIYFAIESEIQSVEFYNRLAEAALESDIKALFSRLAEEEKGHIVRLQYMFRSSARNLLFPALSHQFFRRRDYFAPCNTFSGCKISLKVLVIAIQKEKSCYQVCIMTLRKENYKTMN